MCEACKVCRLDCPNLEFCGLMTIGMLDYTSTPENFKTLANCQTEVCKALGILEEQCGLSMGMSTDFELAIELGIEFIDLLHFYVRAVEDSIDLLQRLFWHLMAVLSIARVKC